MVVRNVPESILSTLCGVKALLLLFLSTVTAKLFKIPIALETTSLMKPESGWDITPLKIVETGPFRVNVYLNLGS